MFNKAIPSHAVDVTTLRVLKANNFEHENSDDMYSDYRRVVGGFGEDGTDRNERLTFIAESGSWYPTACHIDLSGNYWHERTGPTATIEQALAWLKEDEGKAPKQK